MHEENEDFGIHFLTTYSIFSKISFPPPFDFGVEYNPDKSFIIIIRITWYMLKITIS